MPFKEAKAGPPPVRVQKTFQRENVVYTTKKIPYWNSIRPVNEPDQVVPVFSALELFLSILAAAPEREQLRMTRYW